MKQHRPVDATVDATADTQDSSSQRDAMNQLELGNAAMQETLSAMSTPEAGGGFEDLEAWWSEGLAGGGLEAESSAGDGAPLELEQASAGVAAQGVGASTAEVTPSEAGSAEVSSTGDSPASTSATSSSEGPSRSSAPTAGGPTGEPMLDGALSAAFGANVDGVNAEFGEVAENDALGAEAHAEGQQLSFGEGIQPAAPQEMDPEVLNTIAHEMAHALGAAGGPEPSVDLEEDKGEERADAAGAGFQRWAERGFEGKTPKLKPAEGGGARTQRKASAGSNRLTGAPALRRGSRGGQVSTLQTLLRRHGHSVAVDGDFGPSTERAVQAFQRAKGLSVDGVVGPQTAGKLNASPSKKKQSANKPKAVSLSKWLPLRQGDRNTGVSRAQSLLNRFNARISTDGVFGPGTARAVQGFQRANGLQRDGVIGPATAAKLNKSSSRKVDYSGGGSSSGELPGKYLGEYAAYRYGRYQGMIKVVQMEGKKVALKTARAWKKLKDAARRDGVTLTLNSGFRTMAEQQSLYQRYLNGTGNLAARPGYSNHQHGQALDISVVSSSAYKWMHNKAGRYGWRRTVSSEPWHWEYFGG